MIEHYLYMLDEGMDRTDSMEALKLAKRDEDSNAIQFIEQRLEEGALVHQPLLATSRSVSLAKLHKYYISWCTDHAVPRLNVMNQRTFRMNVESRYEVKNSGGWRVTGLQRTMVEAVQTFN